MPDVENNGKQRQLGGRSGKGFLPGQSGNPGGRPKDIGGVQDLARQHTALAIETLVQIMQHGDRDAARVAAAQALLDRGWGKAVQSIETADVTPLRIILDYADVPTALPATKEDVG